VAWAQIQLTGAVDRELPEPAAALLLGIAFGIHQPLAPDVRAPLQDAGLIHIVVVSGLKVVLIIGLVSALGRVFEWSRRRALTTNRWFRAALPAATEIANECVRPRSNAWGQRAT
jgi:predicted membrane metal-binding protein